MREKKNIFLGLLIAASLMLTIGCGDPDGENGGGTTPTAVTFESAVQTGGTPGTVDSTALTLTFSVDPTTLTADDITVTGATKGTLSGSGTTRSLAISNITVGNGATVSVAINSPSGYSITGSPQTAVVYKKVYAIGDTGPAGGLIFYIDKADSYSWTYLEVAPASTEWSRKAWGGYKTLVTGANGTVIGTGAQNTIDIVTQFGDKEPYEDETDYAAKLCSELEYGGYDDWFLPSKDELGAIWNNLVDNGSGSNSGVGGFADDYYWSSSESDSYYAWFQYFDDGYQYDGSKNANGRVRAVRAF